jgi:AcrR family transcriptional regulator
MPTTAEDLRRVALEEFASSGYHATSIQQIADRAGVSKATVLYHFTSKEMLLESVLAPAIDQLDRILGNVGLAGLRDGGEKRAVFLEQFVDFLLEHRSAVYVFVNQSASLIDVPIIDRAMGEVAAMAEFFEEQVDSVEEKVRFGVALGGAAYLLAGAPQVGPAIQASLPELRSALLAVLGDLLAVQPLASAPATTTN